LIHNPVKKFIASLKAAAKIQIIFYYQIILT